MKSVNNFVVNIVDDLFAHDLTGDERQISSQKSLGVSLGYIVQSIKTSKNGKERQFKLSVDS